MLQRRVIALLRVKMRIGMVGNLLAGGGDRFGGFRVHHDVRRHQTERHVNLFFREQLQKFWRVFRERPIVEDQSDVDDV